MILAAGLCIALWYYTNALRDARMNEMRVAAESERAALIIKNAQDAAQTERELNGTFVRSFVRSYTQQQQQQKEMHRLLP